MTTTEKPTTRSSRSRTSGSSSTRGGARAARRPKAETPPEVGSVGRLVLVGAGPGDPGLLTVRARQLLEGAAVVVSDADVPEDVLETVPEGAHLVRLDGGDVEARAAAVVAEAEKAGPDTTVVRLVRGDAALLSTWPVEARRCRAAGVAVELVPGVAVGTAVPAHAGVPLGADGDTGVLVVDATELDLEDAAVDDWAEAAVLSNATRVVLRVADRLQDVLDLLIDAGLDPETPAALVGEGSTSGQRTVVATADTLVEQTGGDVPADAVLVVGGAVGAREELSWFETRPLFAWRVLVPRTRDQAGALVDRLRSLGAVPVEVPTIAVEPPRSDAAFNRAFQGIGAGRYGWLALTSTNAVRAVREKATEFGVDARILSGVRVAAVGESTAEALRAWGIEPDLVPAEDAQNSEGLVAAWSERDEALDEIGRVLLPRADIATDVLREGLEAKGWTVEDVTAYRTVRAAPPPAPVRDAIKRGDFDAVVFTSSSTVRNLVGIAGKPHVQTGVVVIGPKTREAAEEQGLTVSGEAATPDVDALCAALARYAEQRRAEGLARPSEVARARRPKNAK